MSEKRIGSIILPVNRLHMELTNMCNFSCEFCPDSLMKRPRGMIPLDRAKSLLHEVHSSQIAKVVHFHLMGEPTLHPHLIEILSYASSLGIETSLTTNGSLLDNELLSALIDSRVNSLILSLQTPDAKTFALRGSKGITFHQYSENIVRAARRFLSAHNTGTTTLTISFLSSPLRWLSFLGLPAASIADTSAQLRAYLKTWLNKIIESPHRLKDFETAIKQIEKTSVFKINTVQVSQKLFFLTRILGDWSADFTTARAKARFGYCPAIEDNFGILYNGDYVYCCVDYDGCTAKANVREYSMTDYLNLPAVQRIFKGFKGFRVHDPYCQYCLGDKYFLNALVKQIGSIIYFKTSKNKKERYT